MLERFVLLLPLPVGYLWPQMLNQAALRVHQQLDEQEVGRFPLGWGLAVEHRPTKLSCTYVRIVEIELVLMVSFFLFRCQTFSSTWIPFKASNEV